MANTASGIKGTSEFVEEELDTNDKNSLSEDKEFLEECNNDEFQKCELENSETGKQMSNSNVHILPNDAKCGSIQLTINDCVKPVVPQSKNSYIRYDFRYVDFLIPRPELEPEEKGGSEEGIKNGFCSLPSFIILISLMQISFNLIGYEIESCLRYESLNKTEIWRFWTYFLVHGMYNTYYFFTDVIMQLFIGLPLEKVHKWWRVMIIYLSGTVAGSLLESVHNGNHLTGGRGGIYALLTAHVISVILNQKQMRYPIIQLIVIGSLVFLDISWYMRDLYYWDQFLEKGILAHIGGVIAGIFVGIHILRSHMKINTTENYIRWTSFTLFVLLGIFAIVVDLVVLR